MQAALTLRALAPAVRVAPAVVVPIALIRVGHVGAVVAGKSDPVARFDPAQAPQAAATDGDLGRRAGTRRQGAPAGGQKPPCGKRRVSEVLEPPCFPDRRLMKVVLPDDRVGQDVQVTVEIGGGDVATVGIGNAFLDRSSSSSARSTAG